MNNEQASKLGWAIAIVVFVAAVVLSAGLFAAGRAIFDALAASSHP